MHHLLFLLHYHRSTKQQMKNTVQSSYSESYWFAYILMQNPVCYEAAFCKVTFASKYFLLIPTVLIMRPSLCYREVQWIKNKLNPSFRKI